jgi:hypothetical protein
MICKRHYFKWNINEIIALQREYELLKLSIQEIANTHQRSIRSILCKLEQENFIKSWNEAKGFKDYVERTPELEYIRDYGGNDDNDNDGDNDNECDDDDDDDDDEEEYQVNENLSDITIDTEEESEINYATQVNNIGFAMSVKQFLYDLLFMVKKFTNTISNNSSSNNLAEM